MFKLDTLCANMSLDICGQRRPRSACASAQSDHGLYCLLTDLFDTTECNTHTLWFSESTLYKKQNIHVSPLAMGAFACYDWFNKLYALNKCFIHFWMLYTLLFEWYSICKLYTWLLILCIKMKGNQLYKSFNNIVNYFSDTFIVWYIKWKKTFANRLWCIQLILLSIK